MATLAWIRCEVATTWQGLLDAVARHVELCPAAELAAGDADRLDGLARAIRLRLAEESKPKPRETTR